MQTEYGDKLYVFDQPYDGSDLPLDFCGIRPETDTEYYDRVTKLMAHAAVQESAERKQYEMLKNKFEKTKR